MVDKEINHEFGFIILILSLSIGLLFYFFSGLSENVFFSPNNLPENICKYENDYLTCGADYVIYDYEGSYNLVANQPLYFPDRENNLIDFVNNLGPYGGDFYQTYLQEGENILYPTFKRGWFE